MQPLPSPSPQTNNPPKKTNSEFRVESDGQRAGGALESARERNRALEGQVSTLQRQVAALQASRGAQDGELARLRRETAALVAAASGFTGGGGGGGGYDSGAGGGGYDSGGGGGGYDGGGGGGATPNASVASAAGAPLSVGGGGRS